MLRGLWVVFSLSAFMAATCINWNLESQWKCLNFGKPNPLYSYLIDHTASFCTPPEIIVAFDVILGDSSPSEANKASGTGLGKGRTYARMPPELLIPVDVSAKILRTFYLLPSFMHRLESLLLASQLKEEIGNASNVSSFLVIHHLRHLDRRHWNLLLFSVHADRSIFLDPGSNYNPQM